MPFKKTQLIVWNLFITAILTALPSSAQEPIPVFVQPPAPQELATILFGPRYRSVDAGPATDRFGMLINFKLDSAQLLPQSLPLLDSVGETLTLRSFEKEVLVIEGHADSRGTTEHNQALSLRRAAAIKRYLVNTFNVSSTRLVTLGKGETEPYDDDSEAAINRRVEFRAIQSIIVN